MLALAGAAALAEHSGARGRSSSADAAAADRQPPIATPAAGICAATSASSNQNVNSISIRRSDQRRSRLAGSWRSTRWIRQRPFFGLGVGYQWNNWFRFDVTGEYRGKAEVQRARQLYRFCPGGRRFDVYDGSKSAWVVLANAYIDLGTWWCITPFIGAGVGGAYNTIEQLHATSAVIAGGGTGFGSRRQRDRSGTWPGRCMPACLQASRNNFKVELAYRYLNMGNALETGEPRSRRSVRHGNGPRAFYTLNNINSHDFSSACAGCCSRSRSYAPPPLMRRG